MMVVKLVKSQATRRTARTLQVSLSLTRTTMTTTTNATSSKTLPEALFFDQLKEDEVIQAHELEVAGA